MKLDRNITNPKRGKYALIKLRTSNLSPEDLLGRSSVEVRTDAIDFGDTEENEFFVIRLKDKYAYAALASYAMSAREGGDHEYASEIDHLASKALYHPNKKQPD